MTLREKIEAAVAAAMQATPNDAKAVALAACAAFEWEVEIGGNGWWDDDEAFIEFNRRWRTNAVLRLQAGMADLASTK